VVYLKYPSNLSATFGPSHVVNYYTVGNYTVAEVTAGDDEVKFL
jgi:hypothetical protein